MKKYIRPEIEIKEFEVWDVIAASGEAPGSLSYTDDEDVVWSGWADFNTLK